MTVVVYSLAGKHYNTGYNIDVHYGMNEMGTNNDYLIRSFITLSNTMSPKDIKVLFIDDPSKSPLKAVKAAMNAKKSRINSCDINISDEDSQPANTNNVMVSVEPENNALILSEYISPDFSNDLKSYTASVNGWYTDNFITPRTRNFDIKFHKHSDLEECHIMDLIEKTDNNEKTFDDEITLVYRPEDKQLLMKDYYITNTDMDVILDMDWTHKYIDL